MSLLQKFPGYSDTLLITDEDHCFNLSPPIPSPSTPLYSPWNSPSQNTGLGNLSLHQGIFPTQGSNPGLPHCRKILYQLSHKGHPRILEWVTYPFSSEAVISSAAAASLQSCLTLCDPIDSSPPGSPIPGILQARTLEWVSISFSNA